MLDIIKGRTTKNAATEQIIAFLKDYPDKFEGRFYVGYIMPTSDGIVLDCLWISKKYGVIIFNIENEVSSNKDKEDNLFGVVDQEL
jgi:hypothetical protein